MTVGNVAKRTPKERSHMDRITELIKNEIKLQYKSLSKFSEASGIPYSTLSYMMTKGVGSTSYETVVRICDLLHIRQAYDEGVMLLSQNLHDVYSKLLKLDDTGIHTVCAVLNAEYARCTEQQDNTSAKGYNGIGYAACAQALDEERIKQLVEKVKRGEA